MFETYNVDLDGANDEDPLLLVLGLGLGFELGLCCVGLGFTLL